MNKYYSSLHLNVHRVRGIYILALILVVIILLFLNGMLPEKLYIFRMPNNHSREKVKDEAKVGERLALWPGNEAGGKHPELEALRQGMKRCTVAMGVTENSLKENSIDINILSTKAIAFLNAIWSFVPRRFSKNYKNPCWYSDFTLSKGEEHTVRSSLKSGMTPKQVTTLAHGLLNKVRRKQTQRKTLFCLPNFFIAGFPKSGTTSLDRALRQHPQIANPISKEVHWWTRTPLQDLNQNYLQLAVLKYLIHYSNVTKKVKVHKDSITYDGSQSTLWDARNFVSNGPDFCIMPAVISQVLPEAKFIVVMRNPITRLYSHYLYGCSHRRGYNISKWPVKVRSDPAGDFHREVVLDIQRFNECLHKYSLYECVSENRYLGNNCGGVGNKLTVSMYYVHLLKWFQFYSKKQFLFLRMENMDTDPHEFLFRITKFLGLHPVSPKQAEQWLKTKMNVQKAINENPSMFTMWNETWRLLEDFYKPYNAMLAKFTADKRFLWSDYN